MSLAATEGADSRAEMFGDRGLGRREARPKQGSGHRDGKRSCVHLDPMGLGSGACVEHLPWSSTKRRGGPSDPQKVILGYKNVRRRCLLEPTTQAMPWKIGQSLIFRRYFIIWKLSLLLGNTGLMDT